MSWEVDECKPLAPGMAAVCWRNAYYGDVIGKVFGSFLLILHPIALLLAGAYTRPLLSST